MLNRYVIIGLLIIVALMSLWIGFLQYKGHKESFNTLDYKPKGTEIVVVGVHNRDMTVVNKAGESKTVPLPRKGEVVVRIEPAGEFSIKQPSLVQVSYFLGVELSPISCDPDLGIQWLQWNKLGLCTNISLKGVSLSLTRDLYDFYPQLQNTMVGIGIRQNWDSTNQVFLHVGVYL